MEKFMEDSFLWEETHSGAGEGCEERAAVETMCDELTTTTSPCPSGPLGGKKQKNQEES